MLLKEILLKEVEKPRNFVAKYAQSKSGAGIHQPKKGKKAPKKRQRREGKKEIKQYM